MEKRHPVYGFLPAPKAGDSIQFYRQGCLKPGLRLIDRVSTDNGEDLVHIVKTGKSPDGVTVQMRNVRPAPTAGEQPLWEYHSFNR